MTITPAHTKESLIEYLMYQDQRLLEGKKMPYAELYRNFEKAVASWSTLDAGKFAKDIKCATTRYLFFVSLFIKLGDLKEAKNTIQLLEKKYARIVAYRAICLKLADNNQFEEAMHETKNIRKEIHRQDPTGFVASVEERCHGSTLEEIAVRLFERGRIEEALNYAQEIPYPIYKYSALECMQNRRTLIS